MTTALEHTTDGGRTCATLPNPCPSTQLGLWSVRFATAGQGWLLCAGEPATDMESKALFETTDDGVSWQLRSSSCLFNGMTDTGDIPCLGYLPGIAFAPGGFGLLCLGRGELGVTADSGAHWSATATRYVVPDVQDAQAVSTPTAGTGEALVHLQNPPTIALITTSGNAPWTVQHTWANQ